ncbi:MAG: hypothetical protein KBA00_00145 [Moraxella sp.]|jgi:hypothetical protein|uniref:DUF4440 domain-containing protein n=1 Tax=Faucicola osloensis TaxID=34062 RepID=A0A6P1KBB5_FAUOS|nr:hypothetical protein [Moraxella osloensis]MBP6340763.1 hypothetical protein [Moraxella sp.]MBP7233431.1 hypothetical protein [Moraxella sp.]QHG09369.1 hypothetical protein GSF12_05390 [Moraxella osloensis]
MTITLNFQPIDKIRKQVKSKLWLGLVMATSLTVPTLANAEITQRDIDNYGTAMAAAANAKSISRVASLVADDALISVSRKGKTTTLNKSNYLNLLQNNWSKATRYGYDIQLNNVVISGNHAKADAITTEVIVENNVTTRLVTTSRITFAESGNSVLLSRAISQLVIEKH